MSGIETKQPPANDPGAFVARVYMLNWAPDAHGDVITARVPDGHSVKVSLDHDVMLAGAEPAGTARLFTVGQAVVAYGQAANTDRGRALRAKLLAAGDRGQWSPSYWTSPDRGFSARLPTAAELKQWPETQRVIESWVIPEIAHVTHGACGVTCRTLSAKGLAAKCGAACSCAPPATVSQAELREIAAKCDPWTPEREAAFKQDLARFHAQQGTTPGVVVPPLKAQTAAHAVSWCADWWGLRFQPGVKFLNKGDMPHADWVGFALGGDLRTAHIASDRHGWDLVDTALHETCHIARRALGLPYGEQEVEADVRYLLPLYAEEIGCSTRFAGN